MGLGGWQAAKAALAVIAALTAAGTVVVATRRFGVRPEVAALVVVVLAYSGDGDEGEHKCEVGRRDNTFPGSPDSQRGTPFQDMDSKSIYLVQSINQYLGDLFVGGDNFTRDFGAAAQPTQTKITPPWELNYLRDDTVGDYFPSLAPSNDNEQVFSSQVTFDCWDIRPLLSISGIFRNDFLHMNTTNDPDEIRGAPVLESGWFIMDGAVANSSTTTIADPAFLALYLESTPFYGLSATLPFTLGEQTNGQILSQSLSGN